MRERLQAIGNTFLFIDIILLVKALQKALQKKIKFQQVENKRRKSTGSLAQVRTTVKCLCRISHRFKAYEIIGGRMYGIAGNCLSQCSSVQSIKLSKLQILANCKSIVPALSLFSF